MRLLAPLLLLGFSLAAQEPVDFTKQIAPILVQRCIECHGPEDQEGDLRLDAKEHVFINSKTEDEQRMEMERDVALLKAKLRLAGQDK